MVGVKQPMKGVIYLPPKVAEHYHAAGVLTEDTLVGALRDSFARHSDRIAVSEEDVRISYRELDEITERAAAALVRLGLRALDPVLFQVYNCKELVFAVVACLKAGLLPICTLAAHRRSEIGQIGRQAGARAHIVSAPDGRFDLVSFALEMKDEIPTVDHVIAVRTDGSDIGEALSFERLAAAEDLGEARETLAAIEHDPWQVAIMQLSGGTSGTPKIIPRFNNDYLYTMRSTLAWFGFDESLVSFTPNPMMHNAPMACFWGPALAAGGEVAIAAGQDIAAIDVLMAARKPTWNLIAMVHILRLQEYGTFDRQKFDNAYGFVILDGAREVSDIVGAPAYRVFGMTEGLVCFGRHSDPPLAVTTTVGNPVSEHDEIKLVGPGSTDEVQPGEAGELLVRGPCTIRGYYDAQERNAEAFTADGFYRSGDLMSYAFIEGRRYLRFEGRVKDVVDRGGEKINCSEVETAIAKDDRIGAVACVGMPDRLYGERLCAFIVMQPGEKAPTVAELGDFLGRQGLAKFKFPERIEVLEELPMTSAGKLSKPQLRKAIADKVAAEQGEGA
jgi:non-ribosomal peptide synthetase component E (peptide arylation enzyme)